MLYPSKLEVFKKLHSMGGNGGHEVIARVIPVMSACPSIAMNLFEFLLALRDFFF